MESDRESEAAMGMAIEQPEGVLSGSSKCSRCAEVEVEVGRGRNASLLSSVDLRCHAPRHVTVKPLQVCLVCGCFPGGKSALAGPKIAFDSDALCLHNRDVEDDLSEPALQRQAQLDGVVAGVDVEIPGEDIGGPLRVTDCSTSARLSRGHGGEGVEGGGVKRRRG